MLTKRIIACLDVDAGRVVKGIHFSDLRDAGDPAELAPAYSRSGADEIILLDISATNQKRSTLLQIVRKSAQHLFVPSPLGEEFVPWMTPPLSSTRELTRWPSIRPLSTIRL